MMFRVCLLLSAVAGIDWMAGVDGVGGCQWQQH